MRRPHRRGEHRRAPPRRDHALVGIADLAATFTTRPLESFRAARERTWLPRLGLYPVWEDVKDAGWVLTDDDRAGEVFVAGVKVLLDGA